MHCKYLLPFLTLILVSISSCSVPNTEEKVDADVDTVHLGEIDFEVSGSAAAKENFEKGLLLLHSFEYEDARDEFIKAQQKDSSFAMAYWGEAMTYNHSLWQRQEKEDAMAALEKFGSNAEARLERVKTELERDFFEGIEILFGEGTKYDRDLAYKNHMFALTEKYPEHHEVAAFYAISLLGSSRNGRDEELYAKSAQIAKGIMTENPSHPGALHYLIHSYDDPVHAHLAKSAADNYSKVAPDAAHALHMPSHIYVALGHWNDVVNSNIASWNASVKRKEHKELDNDALSYHALNWLQYGFLQRGEVNRAAELLNNIVKFENEKTSKKARGYLLKMKAAQMIEAGEWDGEFANINIDLAELKAVAKGQHAFLEGMKAYHKKDLAKLKNILKGLGHDRQKAQVNVGEEGFAMCGGTGYGKSASQLDVDMIHVMEMELQAYTADLQGDFENCNRWFEKACALDESLSYSYGPPDIVKPVHEAYGEWLLSQNNSDDALTIFEKALERYPRRLRALQGKKKAAELLRDKEMLVEAEQELSVSLAEQGRAIIL